MESPILLTHIKFIIIFERLSQSGTVFFNPYYEPYTLPKKKKNLLFMITNNY